MRLIVMPSATVAAIDEALKAIQAQATHSLVSTAPPLPDENQRRIVATYGSDYQGLSIVQQPHRIEE
jgi:hypothetical protein